MYADRRCTDATEVFLARAKSPPAAVCSAVLRCETTTEDLAALKRILPAEDEVKLLRAQAGRQQLHPVDQLCLQVSYYCRSCSIPPVPDLFSVVSLRKSQCSLNA